MRRLVRGKRMTRAYGITYSASSATRKIICVAVPSLTPVLRYVLPSSNAVLRLAILLTTVTMYTRGARHSAHGRHSEMAISKLSSSAVAHLRSRARVHDGLMI